MQDDPQIGDLVRVSAFIQLGSLVPDDVCVEVAHGKVSEGDELLDTSFDQLTLKEDLGDGRFLFSGEVQIDRSGSFGYTVRVLPHHPSLASKSELGLVTNA